MTKIFVRLAAWGAQPLTKRTTVIGVAFIVVSCAACLVLKSYLESKP